MDLEHELQRVLHTRDAPVTVTDPVGAVHAGMRRRRRTQRIQVLSAGLGAVVVALGAALLVGNPLATSSRPLPPASQPPTPQPRSDQTAVPVGFTVQDLSFVSTGLGWALGTTPCGDTSCTVQLVTTDGGETWVRRPAAGLPRICGTSCVTHVRFADEHVGYAFGPSLYVTTNGGKTWAQQSTTPVYGLEIAGGTVTRVVAQQDGCPGCTFVVQTSDVASLIWNTRYVSALSRSSAALMQHGSRLAVPLYANPAGGAGDAHAQVLLSADNGSTWHVRDDPCGAPGSNSPDEVDARDLSFGPEGLLAATCVPRLDPAQSTGTAVRLSTDSGRSFGPARLAPGLVGHLAAVSSDRVVVEVTDGKADALFLTRDGGRTWTRVAQQPRVDSRYDGTNPGFLAFSTARVGTWVGGDGTSVWRTYDGGATWAEHPFR
jgi:hypothetical protein